MDNDSLSTLFNRHYGPSSPTPAHLEARLTSSLYTRLQEIEAEASALRRLRTKQISRRRVMQLVTLSSASVGVLGLALEGLQQLVSQPPSSISHS